MKRDKVVHTLMLLALLPASQVPLSADTEEQGNVSIVASTAERPAGSWFIDQGAGPGMYLGGFNANFSERLTPTWYLGFGKWLTPGAGIRAGMDFGHKYREFLDNDRHMFYGWNIHADFLWDVFNTFGDYKEDRIYHLIPYLGAGYAQVGLCPECAKVDKGNHFTGTGNAFNATVGIINKFRLSSIVDLNLELSSALANGRLDMLENVNGSIDSPVAIRLGLSFNIGGRRSHNNVATKEAPASGGTIDAVIAMALSKPEAPVSETNIPEAVNEDPKDKVVEEAPADTATKVSADKGYAVSVGEDVITVSREAIVLFTIGHSSLNYNEYQQIHRFVECVKKVIESGNTVELVGSADRQTGNPANNMALSKKRVEYVKNILIRDCDIPADKIETVAEGDANNRFLDPEMNRCVYVRFK